MDGIRPFVVAGAGAILGPLAGAGLDVLIPSLWRRRVDRLIAEIAARLDGIEAQMNDAAATSVAIAMRAAVTSDDVKIEYLANAVANTVASEQWKHDSAALLMRLVGDLTASHLRVLDLLADPSAWVERHDVLLHEIKVGDTYPWWASIEAAFDESGAPLHDAALILGDLEALGLLTTVGSGDHAGTDRPPEFNPDVVSDLGRRLRLFVTWNG